MQMRVWGFCYHRNKSQFTYIQLTSFCQTEATSYIKLCVIFSLFFPHLLVISSKCHPLDILSY